MNFTDPYQYPNAGYGLYCVRCHAFAGKESTFASLTNIEGYVGTDGEWPIAYRVDDSWRAPGWQQTYEKYLGICKDCPIPLTALTALTRLAPLLESAHNKNMELSALHVAHPGPAPVDVPSFLQTFPPEPWDKKVAGPEGHMPPYLTSDQCTGCHSGFPKAANSAFGPSMVVYPPGTTDASKNINVSEYGEWRWSPMGLAGRDPVFFSQLESEFSSFPGQKLPELPRRHGTEKLLSGPRHRPEYARRGESHSERGSGIRCQLGLPAEPGRPELPIRRVGARRNQLHGLPSYEATGR